MADAAVLGVLIGADAREAWGCSLRPWRCGCWTVGEPSRRLSGWALAAGAVVVGRGGPHTWRWTGGIATTIAPTDQPSLWFLISSGSGSPGLSDCSRPLLPDW